VTISDGRIVARPGVAPTTSMAPGIHDLVVAGSDRYCWLVVPTGYEPTRAWPLTLFFRGAITPARNYLDSFRPIADEFGMIILAPEATYRTWDLILGGFGPDVTFINQALQEAFRNVRVDPARVYSSGFSDGASYSLSLGLTNGDFLTRVAAYSPGLVQAAAERGHPEFFITHGTMDQVLPIDSTSRWIVDELRHAGYTVEYREFDGPHAVKLSLVQECFEWMTRPVAAPRRG
jgi:phospholipase/carboxylesterase